MTNINSIDVPAIIGSPAGRVAAFVFNFLKGFFLKFGLIIAIVALWELALHDNATFHFHPPSAIFAKFKELWFSGPTSSFFVTPAFWADVVPSVSRALGGWALGGTIGIIVGLVAGSNAAARAYIEPVVSYLRSIPKAALIPTFLIVFGATDTTRILAISFATVWLVLLNTMQGVRSLDPVMRQTGEAFKVPRWKQFTHIVLPAASPKIIAGLRVTLSLSLIIMLVSEWVLSSSGIGYFLINSQQNYDVVEMWAALLLIALIGYVLNTGFLMIEKRLLGWHRGAHGQRK
ncbi:ABC transporter permease [Roseibium sp. M-1]